MGRFLLILCHFIAVGIAAVVGAKSILSGEYLQAVVFYLLGIINFVMILKPEEDMYENL